MPKVAGSVKELLAALDGIARIEGDRPRRYRRERPSDARHLRSRLDGHVQRGRGHVEAARWIVWEASQAVGARSASIQDLYKARSRGEYEGMTVPAINLRAQTFDMARVILETAKKNDSAAVIFELARSEQTYTFQRVFEYATSILAGAIAAGWKGPVFIQGDHYQFNAKKYAADPEKMTEEIRKACRDAIAAGYRNIDIDSSTLVDLGPETLDDQQHQNYMRAAELTALIRSLEVDGVTVSVGGEIGEVGKKNSTSGRAARPTSTATAASSTAAPAAPSASRRSRVQTGTSHGGMPLAGGGVAEVALDFGVLTELSATSPASTACRARSSTARARCRTTCSTSSRPPAAPRSTWPPASRTPCSSTRPSRPSSTRRSRSGSSPTARTSARPARRTSSSSTPAARRRSARSSASSGISPPRTQILASQAAKVDFLFKQLGTPGSRALVEKYVKPVEYHQPMPAALKAAAVK